MGVQGRHFFGFGRFGERQLESFFFAFFFDRSDRRPGLKPGAEIEDSSSPGLKAPVPDAPMIVVEPASILPFPSRSDPEFTRPFPFFVEVLDAVVGRVDDVHVAAWAVRRFR